MNLTEALNAIAQGTNLGINIYKQATHQAAFFLISVLLKFLLVIVLAIVTYKIAKIWLPRIRPDKNRFEIARDSVLTALLFLVGLAAWKLF